MLRVWSTVTATALAMALLIPIARAGTPMALVLSHDQVRSLEQELRDELHALDAFARGRSTGALGAAPAERPGAWLLYGRLGPLKFRNELDPLRFGGMRLGLGSTGPGLTGRVNIGIYRRFH